MSYPKKYDLKKNYGLAIIDYNRMVKECQGRCPICHRRFHYQNKYNKPHVDHNHDTGEVRGILCGYCNVALGFLRENPDAILRLRDYIVMKGGAVSSE
jgi:hypothetical protein